MPNLIFEDLFAVLSTMSLSTADLARLREWLAGIPDPARERPPQSSAIVGGDET